MRYYDDSYLRDVIRDVGQQMVAAQPTFRERLICAALQGILAGPAGKTTVQWPQDTAAFAIKHADAVLARLADEGTKG